MSKAYRMMSLNPKRKLMLARTDRPMRSEDKTGDSPLVPVPDAIEWFPAMTAPRRERDAVKELERAGYAAWFPQETKTTERRELRKVITANEPLFPRYIFVGMRPGAIGMRGCRFMTVLLRQRVPMALLHELYRRQSRGEFNTSEKGKHKVGDAVKVPFGPFSELDGIVTRSSHERIAVLVKIFGSEREIIVDARNAA